MKILLNKIEFYRIIRFAFIGVLNTLIDLAVLNLLVYSFGVVDPIKFSICKGFSFSFAVINSFFMNKYFTFNKKETDIKDFYLFIIISVIGLFVNILVSGFVFYVLNYYSNIFATYLIPTISAIIGSLFTMITNYLGYSYFVFKND